MTQSDGYEVKREKTGWRDQKLSQRHREWGWNTPFADVDFVCVEYDMKKVMGLFDYKRETAPWPPDEQDASLLALADLADRGRVPFFIVRYGRDIDWFEARCFSYQAHSAWASYHKRRMSELEWVTFLYKLRARSVPPAIAAKLTHADDVFA